MDNQNGNPPAGGPTPVPEQQPTPASPDASQGGPAPEPVGVPEQPAVGVADPAAAAGEEKCATCGNGAQGGNCSTCGQNQMSCTCPPAQAGGQGGPSAPVV